MAADHSPPTTSIIPTTRSLTSALASMVMSRPKSQLGLSWSSSVQETRNKSQIKILTNLAEHFWCQLTQSFQSISDSINQSRDETHMVLAPLSTDPQKAYHELQLVESPLSKGEEIVAIELTDAKRNLERFQGKAKWEQDCLTGQIAGALQLQQIQQ